ncbi:Lysophospholipase, partial [Pseudoloma neurophilia]
FLFGLNSRIDDNVDTFNHFFKNVPAKIILAEAPMQKLTIFKDLHIRAWYNITVDETYLSEDKKTMDISKDSILKYIKDNNIDTNQLILAGFSQGGALALYTGCMAPFKFKFVIGYCTYLPYNLLNNKPNKQNIILFNTKQDQIFPFYTICMLKRVFVALHFEIYHFVSDGIHRIYYDKLLYLIKCIENNSIFTYKLNEEIEMY